MANTDVCSHKRAGLFDSKIRRLFQNPEKILSPYVTEGMSVLDLGCGPGFFTIELGKLVGKNGKVTGADLQEEMLFKLKRKIEGTDLENIIELHNTQKYSIGLSKRFDFILVFYMLHEVPDQNKTLNELNELLNDQGKILIVEPKGHVSKKEFEKSIELMKQNFRISKGPKVFYSYSIILEKK
jgi:ubiquinone/menaquinone biosynthesis C-methylase UbiE